MKKPSGGLENPEHALMTDLELSVNLPAVDVGDATVRMEEDERKRGRGDALEGSMNLLGSHTK